MTTSWTSIGARFWHIYTEKRVDLESKGYSKNSGAYVRAPAEDGRAGLLAEAARLLVAALTYRLVLRAMRALVTGGAGFIGSSVVTALVADGHDVVVLDDLSFGDRTNVHPAARLEVIDIRDAAAVDAVIACFRPEAISHHAAQISVSSSIREPVRDAEINVLGSLTVLAAAARSGCRRVVFASSGALYGEVAEPGHATLDTTPKPLTPYACAKLAVETYLLHYRDWHGVECTTLRYGNVYGPRQTSNGEAGVVAMFIERLLAGQPVQVNARKVAGDDGCVRDYIFVDDVVRANVRAMKGEIELSVANIGSGVGTTTRRLLGTIEEAVGCRAELIHADRRTGDVERTLLEPTFEVIGSVTPLAEGIGKTVAWFRDRVTGSRPSA